LLCERVIERVDLAMDERFATNTARVMNRELLVPMLDAIFRTKPADEWIARMRAVAIPCSLIQGVLEALRSDAGSHLVADVDGRYRSLLNPIRIDGERLPIRAAAPRLGEHTDAIIRELRRE
jgi:crotonobetainyl-CoA:carnitine CoA-transferase CaiB-like acyl-CoA transferase